MELVKDIPTLREIRKDLGGAIALVPTMGALHEGHLSLVKAAAENCVHTFVSIYVNPLQFAPNEDFSRYPRDLEKDCAQLESLGSVDFVFAPKDLSEVQAQTSVLNTKLSQKWCGASRPGHFDGVLTVVSKLVNLVQPTDMWFGQKDFQQALLIQKWVRDFFVPTRIHLHPIVRDESGLALSSRNQYLTYEQKEKAIGLSQGLFAAKNDFSSGQTDANHLIDKAKSFIEDLEIEYLALVDVKTLEPIEVACEGSVILAAVRCGQTRLIDNVIL